ncbi:sigma factor [Streptosporangium canum]|uniref:sigma factor n=1 Tax=Streptosporangium canum TaxID=324952 RepID=UPI003F4E3911
MSETDPHIHVEQKVMQAGAAFRNVIVSSLELVPDTPSVVTTGCGLQVPYAMTSPRPESVTCLACREHAHREHLRFAEHRSLLHAVAYRVLGSVAEAEDVVQDAWLRWSRVDVATVADAEGHNDGPGIIIHSGRAPVPAATFHLAKKTIEVMHVVSNPEKLTGVAL